MNVAVVGAGVMGLSVAWNLSRRGHTVTVYDQYAPGHKQGSSHGRSRIVRVTYPDAFWTSIMVEGYPLWKELESASGAHLLSETGLIYFGPEGHADIQGVISSLETVGVRHTITTRQDVENFCPGLILKSNEIGVTSEDGGWAHADNTVHALRNLALASATTFVQEKIVEDQLKHHDLTVIATGAWISEHIPLKVNVQKMTVGYVKARRTGPVWIDANDQMLYGFPSEPDSDSYKVGVHLGGKEFNPNDETRTTEEESLSLIRDHAQQRFGIIEPHISESVACLYTNTENDAFQIGWHNPTTLVVSACSGHGFKFAPWIGKFVTEEIETRSRLSCYPEFSLQYRACT